MCMINILQRKLDLLSANVASELFTLTKTCVQIAESNTQRVLIRGANSYFRLSLYQCDIVFEENVSHCERLACV